MQGRAFIMRAEADPDAKAVDAGAVDRGLRKLTEYFENQGLRAGVWEITGKEWDEVKEAVYWMSERL